MFKRISYIFVLSFFLLLVLAACRRDEEDSTPQTPTESDTSQKSAPSRVQPRRISQHLQVMFQSRTLSDTYDWSPQLVYSYAITR